MWCTRRHLVWDRPEGPFPAMAQHWGEALGSSGLQVQKNLTDSPDAQTPQMSRAGYPPGYCNAPNSGSRGGDRRAVGAGFQHPLCPAAREDELCLKCSSPVLSLSLSLSPALRSSRLSLWVVGGALVSGLPACVTRHPNVAGRVFPCRVLRAPRCLKGSVWPHALVPFTRVRARATQCLLGQAHRPAPQWADSVVLCGLVHLPCGITWTSPAALEDVGSAELLQKGLLQGCSCHGRVLCAIRSTDSALRAI